MADEIGKAGTGSGEDRERRPRTGRVAAAAAAGAEAAAREQPHSLELERSILAVLLDGRNATAIHTVRERAEHPLVFFNRDHRIVYQACIDLDDAAARIDAQAVAELLKGMDFRVVVERLRQQQVLLEHDQLDALGPAQRRALYQRRPEDQAAQFADSALAAIGGYAAVVDLASHYATAASLERNVALLGDYYHKRRLIQSLSRVVDTAFRTTESFDDLVDGCSQAVLGLSRLGQGARRQVHDASEVVTDTLRLISDQVENPHNGVQTGYEAVDEMLMSLRPGGLYVLAARPGVGKTSFALSIIQHICTQEEAPSVLFFSLEVDRVDLMKKLVCAEAQVEFKAVEGRRPLEEHEWAALKQAGDKFRAWSLDLMDVSDLTVQGLRSVAKRHELVRSKIGLIVIDYLQLLGTTRKDHGEYEKISEISRTLKILAREMKVPVMALSQMSRESEKGGRPREPRLSDLRGSGSIEQDADAVMFLHRLGTDEDEAGSDSRDMKLIVGKNRFGPTGVQYLRFLPARQRFVPISRDELSTGAGESPGPADEAVDPAGHHRKLETAPSADEDLFG